MAVQQQAEASAPADAREQWLAERVAEFEANPAMRDRALAMILWDSLTLNQMIGELSQQVREKGIGGMIKALMSGR